MILFPVKKHSYVYILCLIIVTPPNRSLGRLIYNSNNCLQSFDFHKASFVCF